LNIILFPQILWFGGERVRKVRQHILSS
jgi:hypothetical protein